jgi:hypothetical protein
MAFVSIKFVQNLLDCHYLEVVHGKIANWVGRKLTLFFIKLSIFPLFSISYWMMTF